MLKAVLEGKDVHSIAAEKVFNGENNPLAIRQAVLSLDLAAGQTWSDEVKAVWKSLGVREGKQYSSEDKERIARRWLEQYDWNILKAEKTVGRKNTRGVAKQTTFTKVYGGGVPTLASTLRIDHDLAETVWNVYDGLFPRIVEWQGEMVRFAMKNGYITTRWGRKLRIYAPRAYTTAVNYHVQGTAADLLKHCMRKVEQWWKDEEIRAGSVMVIHDEHDAEWHKEDFTMRNIRRYGELMSDSDGYIGVPMPVSPLLVTDSWQHHHKIRGYRYPS
jgi:DNA polymerase I-like protein with 3'-5' exonuclease and polymerase domains